MSFLPSASTHKVASVFKVLRETTLPLEAIFVIVDQSHLIQNLDSLHKKIEQKQRMALSAREMIATLQKKGSCESRITSLNIILENIEDQIQNLNQEYDKIFQQLTLENRNSANSPDTLPEL